MYMNLERKTSFIMAENRPRDGEHWLEGKQGNFLGGNGNVLYRNCGVDYTDVRISQKSSNYILKTTAFYVNYSS